MSRIFVNNPIAARGFETDFATLVSIVRGTSIASLADSDSFIELGLSESLMLRIEADERRTLRATIVSTLNADEVPPARIEIIADGEEPSAALVERRLHSLRQVYAITLLLNSERGEALAAALRADPDADLEEALLSAEERLYLQAAGPGTWWMTVLTKIGKAPKKALNVLSLVYGQGRGMLLERVRAGTDIRIEEAEAMRIKNEAARRKVVFDTFKEIQKIKNPKDRELARRILLSNMDSANPKIAGSVIPGLPPPPDHKNP